MASLNPRSSASKAWVVVLFAALLAAGAATGFCQIFSTFARYDDEGYVMASLQSFLNGHALYDEVYSTFGPAYYLAKGQLTGPAAAR